jgi:transformation/transcription domain-associated protein
MQALNVEVHVLQGLKKCGTPSVDGTTLSRLFRCSVVTLGYCASPPAADAAKYSAEVLERLRLVEANMEKVAGMIGTFLAEVNPHMLQEIWLLNMDFFFERVHQRGYIWSIVQYLLSREESTVIMLPIILKRLMSHLEDVGGEDEEVAGVLVRAFRGVFQAVAKFPAKNQGFLAAHLGRIVMDSFPLATKAARPSNYYHLVRALFRAMGLHINNMDALFAELVGCLPELLQTLDKQLHLADASNRDQIVELFLNIPVRLTNLLSHLHYLMRPLSIALRGTPELVSLGLRTLELCIDHLTAEFLDPILEAQLRPIHEALHALLRMQGSTPIVTTSVIRVLGKLGGRNRKLLYADPVMGYSSRIDIVTMAIPFDGRSTDVDVKPGFDLAFKMLQRPTAVAESKVAAFKYIKTTLLAIIQQVRLTFSPALKAILIVGLRTCIHRKHWKT